MEGSTRHVALHQRLDLGLRLGLDGPHLHKLRYPLTDSVQAGG